MSILSELGQFLGQKFTELNVKIDNKLSSTTEQDIEITDSTKGIILTSPSGKRYRVTIDDNGDFIKQEIEIINPKIICVMGNTAYGTLLDGKEITKNHGKIVEKDGRKFFVTFHPAATIYNQKLVEELKEDFRKLAKFLETKDEPKQYEERRCDYCMAKTKHEVVVMPKVVTRKRRWLFKCTECNHERWLQPYRTVAESLY